MIKYNSDNIVVGEIKQLLSSFNLPSAIVLKKDMTRYMPNKIYIQSQGHDVYQSSSGVNKDGNPEPVTLKKIEDWSYEWGDSLLNITHTLDIKNNIYDSYTHRYLGNYLRFLRDYKGINLMSMYNCFVEDSPNNLSVTITTGDNAPAYKFDSSDNLHKLYMIPVRLGQVYTISLNTARPIDMVAGFYTNNKLLNGGLLTQSFRHKAGCSFSEVFLYDALKDYEPYFNDSNSDLLNMEECLYLFLRVSANYDSSIVILEGDYTGSSNVFINDAGYTEVAYKPSVYDDFGVKLHDTPTRSQLLSCIGDFSYPFADKLIQYLTSNVVLPGDEIVNNIKRAQQTLVDEGYMDHITRYGAWTNEETAACLLCSHKNKSHRELYKDYDCIGYLDSDVESELGGLK